MNTEPELLNERLERLAMVLDEIMPKCALLVRDALELLKEQNGLMLALDQSNAVNGYLNAEVERLNWLLKEQEAKTGHCVSVNDGDVVAIDNDGFPERACFCSECKKYLIASDEYAVYGRYCPFCGAKMESR